ncbi:hypothetical protein [Sphingobium sp. CCH11-B1]|uniref:hypothetical protein n=1 Tax=Sphingobium sp. CCH11-B1 TaxID=1768781 RepID=UPI001E319884|nr:hypothetical protein [Sphingobium sp. CCH11-B1]
MFEHEGHKRCLAQLLMRLLIDRHTARPQLDRLAALDVLKIKICLGHHDLPCVIMVPATRFGETSQNILAGLLRGGFEPLSLSALPV